MNNKSSYNPNIHHRRSIRLKGYDYSQAGLYFITICCYDKICLFGEIIVPNNQSDSDITAQMMLNDAGKIAHECWLEIPNHFPNVVLHEFVVMPNHIHGIIEFVGTKNISKNMKINDNISIQNELNENHATNNKIDMLHNLGSLDDVGAKFISPLRSPSKTIGSVVRGFKIGVTKWMRQNTNIHDVWQRNYHEHIIRNAQSYQKISNYIKNNPTKWAEDKFYMNR